MPNLDAAARQQFFRDGLLVANKPSTITARVSVSNESPRVSYDWGRGRLLIGRFPNTGTFTPSNVEIVPSFDTIAVAPQFIPTRVITSRTYLITYSGVIVTPAMAAGSLRTAQGFFLGSEDFFLLSAVVAAPAVRSDNLIIELNAAVTLAYAADGSVLPPGDTDLVPAPFAPGDVCLTPDFVQPPPTVPTPCEAGLSGPAGPRSFYP